MNHKNFTNTRFHVTINPWVQKIFPTKNDETNRDRRNGNSRWSARNVSWHCRLILLFLIWKLFFSNPGDVGLQPVNSACEAYRSQIEETASAYGMTEYADLILALMMQESSGQGPDVMQSSEGAFNTLYPQVPGGSQTFPTLFSAAYRN